jgi:hypothetical protein
VSSMRLYTRGQFEVELRAKWRLSPTDEFTDTTGVWRTPNGKFILIPVQPDGVPYPDWMMDEVVRQLEALGENPLQSRLAGAANDSP